MTNSSQLNNQVEYQTMYDIPWSAQKKEIKQKHLFLRYFQYVGLVSIQFKTDPSLKPCKNKQNNLRKKEHTFSSYTVKTSSNYFNNLSDSNLIFTYWKDVRG